VPLEDYQELIDRIRETHSTDGCKRKIAAAERDLEI